MSVTKAYQKYCKERALRCPQEGIPNNAISAPRLTEYLVHLLKVGLAFYAIGINILLFFKEHHCLHKGANNPVISLLSISFLFTASPFMKGVQYLGC